MNYSRVYYDVNITVIYFQIGIYISQHLFENVSLLFQSQYSSLSIPVLRQCFRDEAFYRRRETLLNRAITCSYMFVAPRIQIES